MQPKITGACLMLLVLIVGEVCLQLRVWGAHLFV